MAHSSRTPKRNKSQSELPEDFKSVAKRLECDEDEGRLEAKPGKIAKAITKPTAKAAGAKRSD